MNSIRLALSLAASIAMSACAGLDVQTIGTDTEKDNSARGFRYYQSSPYLLVFTDNKGGLNSQILYLPDTTQKMSVRPYAFAAKNDSTLKFENGVLTQAAATVDETIVPKAVLESLKDVLTAAVKGSAFNIVPTEKTEAPTPSLFKIIVKGDKIELKGGEGIASDGTKFIKTSEAVGQ